MELALVGALMSGLAQRVIKELPHELTMVDLTVTTPPDEAPPVKPELVKPEVPTVPVPEIHIRRMEPVHSIVAVATPAPVVTTPAPVAVDIAPVATIPSTAVASIAGTHTIPPYPELARRLGEQGQVFLRITIGADGQVTDVSVTRSSGSERLDEAAKSWVLANWRYRAATENGAGIASVTEAAVVFDLKTARR